MIYLDGGLKAADGAEAALAPDERLDFHRADAVALTEVVTAVPTVAGFGLLVSRVVAGLAINCSPIAGALVAAEGVQGFGLAAVRAALGGGEGALGIGPGSHGTSVRPDTGRTRLKSPPDQESWQTDDRVKAIVPLFARSS